MTLKVEKGKTRETYLGGSSTGPISGRVIDLPSSAVIELKNEVARVENTDSEKTKLESLITDLK